MGAFSIKVDCPGCCPGGRYQLQCRSRSGSASLCGFDEFIPSTPPRYYLAANYGGSARVERYGGDGFSCGGGSQHDTAEATGHGAKTWSASSCAMTNSAGVTYSLAGNSPLFPNTDGSCSVPDVGLGWGLNFCSSFLHAWGPPPTRTQSVTYLWMSSDTTNADCGCVIGAGNATIADCGSGLTISLGSEDTEQSAMDRSDSEWTCWSGEPGCLDSISCCTVTPANRTGRNFNFSQAEYRIRVAGAEGTLVNVELTFARSVGAPYTEIRQFVAAGSDYGDWQTFSITTASGIGTCLIGHRLYVP